MAPCSFERASGLLKIGMQLQAWMVRSRALLVCAGAMRPPRLTAMRTSGNDLTWPCLPRQSEPIASASGDSDKNRKPTCYSACLQETISQG